MMDAIYLTPTSIFPHELPSHTLFGAICSAMADLGSDVPAMLAAFKERPPFLLSSAFPWVTEAGHIHHFLPRPIEQPVAVPADGRIMVAAKMFKMGRFLHESLFNRWIEGIFSETDLYTASNNYTIREGMIYPTSLPLDFSIGRTELAHNEINRLSSASVAFYYTAGAIFRNAGLYCLLRCNDPAWRNEVLAAFRFLEDRGFGGRISSGAGSCQIRTETVDLFDDQPRGRLMSLSRYLPAVEFDAIRDGAWFDLVAVRGRGGDGMMKRQVMMLTEGSTFPDLGYDRYGTIATVCDAPVAVEYGLAFPVGCRCTP